MFSFALLAATFGALWSLPLIVFLTVSCLFLVPIGFWTFAEKRSTSWSATCWTVLLCGGILAYQVYANPSIIAGLSWGQLFFHILNLASFYLVIGLVYSLIELFLWVSPEKGRFAEDLKQAKDTVTVNGSETLPGAPFFRVDAISILGYTTKDNWNYDELTALLAKNPDNPAVKTAMTNMVRRLEDDVLARTSRRDGVLTVSFDRTTFAASPDFLGSNLSAQIFAWIFGWPGYILDLVFGRFVNRIVRYITDRIGGWLKEQGREVLASMFRV